MGTIWLLVALIVGDGNVETITIERYETRPACEAVAVWLSQARCVPEHIA